MRRLLILGCFAALLLMVMGTGTMAFDSPLPLRSPLRTPYPTTSCQEERDCLFICMVAERRDPDGCYAACIPEDSALSTPTWQRSFCDRPGWQRIADWMGLYPLWTDGSAYCVGERL